MSDPFYVRFNIDVDLAEACRRFVNRIENYVLTLMNELHGRYAEPLDPIMIAVETALGEQHLTFVFSSGVFIEVWRERVANDFSRCLQATEALYAALAGRSRFISEGLSRSVVSALAQSEIDLGISWQDGIFTKKGAVLLDENLANEPLRWLADPKYASVLTPFKKGLTDLLEAEKKEERRGDVIKDMYEALEALTKVVTGNDRDLSGNKEKFISMLKLSPGYSKLLGQYIDFGCELRHAVSLREVRKWPSFPETENFVYLTGSFIRLAILPLAPQKK